MELLAQMYCLFICASEYIFSKTTKLYNPVRTFRSSRKRWNLLIFLQGVSQAILSENVINQLITAHKRICEGYVFTPVSQSFCSWGGAGIPACIAGGIPACLAAGLQRGMVSQHALQVSWPTLRGEVEGSGLGGLQAHTWGGLQAHNWGNLQAHTRGGFQAHTQGGVSQHALKQTSPTATAAGGTHPTGMYSC